MIAYKYFLKTTLLKQQEELLRVIYCFVFLTTF